jgi:SAM-dependent methyltransferase
VRITGERVSTPRGGFNPTFQRHVAAYALSARFLGPGRVLDLGCGVGHSFELLAPRVTVGVDIDPAALAGQQRETHVADMRALPFADGAFASILSVQSLEHVPDAERVVAEARRVLEPTGIAVFVTPNRLTFGRPDEIIDPYHYVEYDAHQLRALLAREFATVEIHGLFGSDRMQELLAREKVRMERALSLDRLNLRRRLPRRLLQVLYDASLRLARRREDPLARAITVDDFTLAEAPLETALDLVAVGTSGPPAPRASLP